MNKINLTSIVLSAFIFLSGCNKDVLVDLDIPEAGNYAQLYMSQAANNPISMGISITDQVYEVPYAAHLGGPLTAQTDISVNFKVSPEMVAAYNQKNNTTYILMPEGSYTLERSSAVISKGSQGTGILKLAIKTKGFLEAFESYLLPISISTSTDVNLNKELSTTYFVFTGSYAPGEVPREKVLSMGADAGSFLVDFNGDFLRKDPATGDLLFYKANVASGQFATPPKTISTGWNVMDKVFSFGGNRLIARFASGGGNINQYFLSQDGVFGAQREVGQGWGVISTIVPFKGLLLGIGANGDMTKYPLNGNGDFDYSNIRQIGSGWGGLAHIFPYQNSLITIENNGDMWQYPLTDDGTFGTRKKIGTGWDMYIKVITAGTDLLALDTNGDLWRYKFNPEGLWPLKK
ncbi:BT_3987 domain-containing protein [Pedobacter foliorum]|uniref:BT_3987 domain-containing protein n=1 Tax=Pedobacter foliorum TaxID=2739058 RepID=UPI0015659D26|nr:DUF1735 domain-containing protein [Pedobacter foliorum]NRF37154.1 DUF1735 domain-containing protein [Pedobacter foliorum]